LTVTPAFSGLSLEGEFGAAESGSSTHSDFDALGLGDEEYAVLPRVDFDWGPTHVSAGYFDVGFSGRGRTEGEIQIGGQTFAAGLLVDSTFDLEAVSGVITWDVLPLGPLELGLGFGLSLVDLDLQLVDVATEDRLGTDERFPIPVIAARLGLNGGPLGLGATLGAVEVSVDDGDLDVLDLDVYGEYDLLGGGRHLAGRLILGYRSFGIDASYEYGDSRVDAEVAIRGPYLGLSLSF